MPDDDKKPAADSLEGESSVIEPQQPRGPAEAGPELAGPSSPPPAPRLRSLRRFLRFSNLYLVIFILLVIVAAIGVFTAIKLTDDGSDEPSRAQSLTEQQLAELKGSTTVIGDSQQILDIQSNTVFENQVLMRGNLDVAGTVKVGGPLSLAAVTVGGTSNFGAVQVNGTLSVAGNTTLQGSVTFQGGLSAASGSFSGTLSAGQLNVTKLQLTGDLTISRHIAGGGGTPGRTNGSALGSGGTASVSGSDTAGTVTINTGSGPPAGCFVTINFAVSFGSTPHVVISPSNSSSSSLSYYTNRSTSNFSVCTSSAPSASTTYLFDYHVFD